MIMCRCLGYLDRSTLLSKLMLEYIIDSFPAGAGRSVNAAFIPIFAKFSSIIDGKLNQVDIL